MKKIITTSAVVAALAVMPLSALAMDSMSMSNGMMTVPTALFQQLVSIVQTLFSTVKSQSMVTDSKAANLRVLLNALERQHVDLAAAAVRAGFDGHASFDKAAGELDKNSLAIADAVASVYGQSAKEPFLKIWRSHIGFFVDYTVGAKTGDKAKMDMAVKNLTEGYVPAISDFFAGATGLPRDAVAQLVTQHVLALKGAVDAYGAADYATSYSKQTEAYNQIGKIADALSGAIVKQHPEMF